jgi:nucleoside-diphosphate-sugar epimerase
MRIMVIGGAGFLGTALIESLSKNRANIVQVLDIFSHGFPKKPFKRKNILSPISGSVRNYYDVLRSMEKFKPEVVIHLAAFNSRPETIGDFRTCAEINYVGTANVLQACIALRTEIKKLVFSSTLAAAEPVSHYGISKRAAEDLLQSVFLRFPEGSREVIVLRFAEIYGESEPYTSTSLMNFLVEGMVQKQALGVYGVNEKIDCLHISDAVAACELAIKTSTGSNTSLIDIGTGHGIKIKDLVGFLKEATQYEGNLSFLDSPAVPVQTLIADTEEAKRVLSFEATADLHKEIAALVKARRKAAK